MLRSIKQLNGYKLAAKDDEIGRCKDFLFDDRTWVVRYMVADTATWLPGRKVLISPIALGEPDWVSKLFPLELTRQQIEDAPELDEHAPVSRQFEKKYNKYFGWPYYWAGMYPGGGGLVSSALLEQAARKEKEKEETGSEELENPSLRSVNEVGGYHIHALDGEIGHVDDFIVDDTIWVIRYMVVDTGTWLSGRKVLIDPEWISDVKWSDKQVDVDLVRDSIEQSPPYDPSIPVNREYEVRLYDYYGRPTWWSKEHV